MSKWPLVLLLLCPSVAQAVELGNREVSQHFDLPCGSKKVTVQYSVPAGTNLGLHFHRPEKCSGGSSLSLANVELGLKTGFYSAGQDNTPVVMPNLGLTFRIGDSWFLRANGAAGLANHGPITDFNFGLGKWVTDKFRLTASGGQIVHRTTGWSWSQGGPVGKVTADYFLSPEMFIGLEVFGGPSWDRNDKFEGSYGSTLDFGWRF